MHLPSLSRWTREAKVPSQTSGKHKTVALKRTSFFFVAFDLSGGKLGPIVKVPCSNKAVYLLFWYKSTNTDAQGAADSNTRTCFLA
jgi:hypothetical protein